MTDTVCAIPASETERDALYRELAPLIRRLISRYGTTLEFRNDLRGSLYCRYCVLVDAYDPERGVPLRPYLVRNLCISAYSIARRYWLQQQREIPLEADPGGEVIYPFGYDPTADWEEALDRAQRRVYLTAALKALTLRQRQVVAWRYFEECSFEEIASRLGVQGATARSLLRHALVTLRRKLEPTEA